MKSTEIIQRIKEIAVVPIVRTPDLTTALAAVEAVLEGGINCVEITMTVANALKAIESVADRYGDKVLLGAGTVLDPETARACMLAGAQFFVTPSLNVKVIELARRYSRPIFPGALTPTEILTAWEAGADGVKVFPCNALGGPKYIKSLKGPFPHIDLVPTGGVNLETIADFLAAGSSAVGVGSELIDAQSVASGDYRAVTDRARKFLEIATAARKKPAK
ncbi:MAG TPA: bifunctional 4-hydroxy-2-oxoglutarate aldolase/2-dehydro-3-deoxy-phosphogluconate aldolase [Bryobacteraceae bacterium]|nr:bifunctional 4-hydroxy-2-oxoglutarate aldolase/2-dehydro-3-deoxy-phosphogluconate aldolase [Bryobacteraceae bacterium]HTF66476.1 bifunctional 4-hydroxy-2-oxoglutarate aldolase/2-dehydro-3-deoxy-phosphogluconate aldolase [Edaphobacter sp.]